MTIHQSQVATGEPVTFSFVPANEGQLTLTLTGRSKIPIQRTIAIVGQANDKAELESVPIFT